MIDIDIKYANLILPQLQNGRQKSEFIWNSRCCLCGDSKKNPKKARLFIYKRFNGLFVKCHNCQFSSSLGTFLEKINPDLYKSYVIDRYQTGNDKLPHTDIGKVLNL
jgi:hypothetical protein